jgi:hypothetical protein
MQPADNRGVLLGYDRHAPKCDTTGIFQEIFGNRHHGTPSPDGTTTFLIATFYENGVPYLIIGSSQMRTKEDINYELTPFKANLRTDEEEAKVREKGYGAKLFPFHMRGCFSMLYQTADHPTFRSDEGDWMMTRETDMRDLSQALKSEEAFDLGPFVPYHKSAKNFTPFWRLPGLVTSKLMDWIRSSPLRSFYMYRDYNEKSDLDDHINRLAMLYEATDVRIMYSKNGGTPDLVTPSPHVSLGLVPESWKHSIVMECKVGTLANRFSDSQFRIRFPTSSLYLKLVPNGKKETVSYNLTEDKDTAWESAEADFSVTGALLSDEYVKPENERKRIQAPYLQQSNSMLARMAFLRIEGDLLSDKPIADEEIGISIRTALLSLDGRFRILVNLLSGTVKDNVDAGVIIEPFKRDTKLRARYGIHECIKRLCTILKRCSMTSFEEAAIRKAADSVVLYRNTSLQRSSEGKKYEQIVGDQLVSRFDMISWTLGDVAIQQRHGLIGQGIDCLGTWGPSEQPEYCIAIQVKDVKTLTLPEVEKFTTSVKQFQVRHPTILVFAFLVWRNPKESIPRKIYEALDEIDARLVFDSNVYTRIEREIGGHYEA